MKKQKLYELIGRLTVYAIGYVGMVAIAVNTLSYIVCNCITTIK